MGAFVALDANTTEEIEKTGYWDPAYSRCDLFCSGSSTKGQSATFFVRSDGAEIVRIDHLWGQLSIAYWNGLTWVGATARTTISETVRNHFDLTWKVNSASGYLRLYSSGTLFADSGIIDLSAVAAVTNIAARGPALYQGISQIAVSSDPTIGWRVGTTYPSGAGTTNTFTSGTSADVDETIYSDADGLTSDTANQIATFATTTILPSGFACKGLSVTVRAKRGTTGPQNMQIAIRTHATNYFSPTIALGVGYGAYCYVWELNPNTGAVWTDAEIAAVEIGVKSIA
jgi:hypothetical protein